MAQFLAALDVAASAGVTPDFNLRVVVDTEEELGSPNLAAAVVRHRERLAADMLVIFDGPPHASGRPTLTFGARGIARFPPCAPIKARSGTDGARDLAEYAAQRASDRE